MNLAVFADAMVFMHYRSLEEIDFPRILGVDSVTIVIPRITIRELDKHKNSHRSRRMRDRLSGVLKKIENWIDSGQPIRQGVSVLYYDRVPPFDTTDVRLSPQWADDVLIATILQYQEEFPDIDVCVVTQDTGPRLTARQFGIRSVHLPENLKVPAEQDPIERENERLRSTIARLERALPELVLCFSGSHYARKHARFKLPLPPSPADEEIARVMKKLREQYPKKSQAERNGRDLSDSGSALSSFPIVSTIPEEEYRRYNGQIDDFLRDYEEYLRSSWEFQAARLRRIKFQLEMRNVGTAPADDVDITVRFPDGFDMYTEDTLPVLAQRPVPPVKPRTHVELLQQSLASFPRLNIPSYTYPEIEQIPSFSLKRTNSYELTDHCERIKHGDAWVLPDLYLQYESYESAGSFNCRYTLRPANLPEPIVGTLHFILERER